jgi:hypothetical protein
VLKDDGSRPNLQCRPELEVITTTGLLDGFSPRAMQVASPPEPAVQLIELKDATGALLVAEVVSAVVVVMDPAGGQRFAEPVPVHTGPAIE